MRPGALADCGRNRPQSLPGAALETKPQTGPWDYALVQLREWDPASAETCARMTTNPWRDGVLSRKLVELISRGLNAACTSLNQWNTAWGPFYELDPAWTDEFMATGAGIYASGILRAKDVELLSIAFDASYTHMYAPGTRRHIQNALKAGATMEEIRDGAETLRRARRAGVQSRRADPRGRAGEAKVCEKLSGR